MTEPNGTNERPLSTQATRVLATLASIPPRPPGLTLDELMSVTGLEAWDCSQALSALIKAGKAQVDHERGVKVFRMV